VRHSVPFARQAARGPWQAPSAAFSAESTAPSFGAAGASTARAGASTNPADASTDPIDASGASASIPPVTKSTSSPHAIVAAAKAKTKIDRDARTINRPPPTGVFLPVR
jgi:hypothetical protein